MLASNPHNEAFGARLRSMRETTTRFWSNKTETYNEDLAIALAKADIFPFGRLRIITRMMMLWLTLSVVPARAEEAPAEGPPPAADNRRVISLLEAQQRAVEANPKLASIDETIRQADIAIYDAWTMLMPNLTGKASVIRNQHEVSIEMPSDMTDPNAPLTEYVIQELWTKNVGFDVNMILFNAQAIPLIKLAKDDYERKQLQAQINRNDIVFAVTAAYYQAYSMEEMIDVAKENLAMAEEFLRHAELLNKAGQATQIDVNRAEIQVVSAEKELGDAVDANRKAMITLRYLMNLREDFALAGPGDVSAVSTGLTELKERALEKRFEVPAAQAGVRMAERLRKYTLTKWIPVFDVTYSWSWASAGGFTGSNINWALIFGAKWDILLGGSRVTEYKVRESDKRLAENHVTEVMLAIEEEVEQSYQEIDKRKRHVAVADRQVALAEQNHDMVSRQFQAGLVSSLDVVDAATELSNQRILRVFQRLQFDLAILTLEKSLGEYHALALNRK